jgi:DnaA family protein
MTRAWELDFAMSKQLPLSLGLRAPPYLFANFVPGNNLVVHRTVLQLTQREGEHSVYLCGSAGTGKTHLLQAAALEVNRQGRLAVYLPLADLSDYPPDALDDLENADLVCLDDIHKIAGQPEWEKRIFSLFNLLRDKNGYLLVSGKDLPQRIGLQLNDLISRLSWGGVFALQPLEDEEKIQALQQHALSRGLNLPANAARYLLQYCPRDMKCLLQWLDRIDYAALAAKRRITLPLVRELFNRMAAAAEARKA